MELPELKAVDTEFCVTLSATLVLANIAFMAAICSFFVNLPLLNMLFSAGPFYERLSSGSNFD